MFFKITFLSFFSCLFLFALVLYQYSHFYDNKLHVVFCDVGQGDGIFIKTPKGTTILVDGGPDTKILSCLSKRMPFWHKNISVLILSHPHADHFAGFIPVVKQYRVARFATEELHNKSLSFKELLQTLHTKHIPFTYLNKHDRFTTKDGVSIVVLSPSKDFLDRTSPTGEISDRKEFASLILFISYHNFSAVLTGDAQTAQLTQAVENITKSNIDILQIPHHGSKFGVDSAILQKIRPNLTVLSVGKKNTYHHPAKEILQLLEKQKEKIVRTDMSGDIEIISDGTVTTVLLTK